MPFCGFSWAYQGAWMLPVPQNSYQDRVWEGKKAKPSAEGERIWTDLLIITGQKNHVRHYRLIHFTWQRQLICEKTHIETDWKKKEHMVLLSVYTELTPKNKDIDYTANKARDILLCNTETSSKLPQMTVKVMNY